MGLSEKELKGKHGEVATELRRQLKEKEKILKGYQASHGQLSVFFNQIAEIIEPQIELPDQEIIIDDKSDTEIMAVMQISDAHMGAVQMADEIEGFNEFNSAICKARQISYANQFNKWITTSRHGYNIQDCAVLVTGDLISGDIHDELKITNEFPVTVQVIEAANVLAKQIQLIKPFFRKVFVHFVTEDNHGRLTKRPQAKEAGLNNLNYLVGYIAKERLKGHRNVEFNIYPQFEKVVEVNGRNYLLCHGHKIVSWMGVPWYSIERKVGKESTARLQIIMNDISKAKDIGFHKYVHGHFHIAFEHPLYSCCPSVSGTDAYDHNAGRFAHPGQSSWLVHPENGDFGRVNFRL